MTGIARTRIGRVTFKGGGADLRVLHPPAAANPVVADARGWLTHLGRESTPPDAYVAVALWFDPADPGHPSYSVGYKSIADGIPAASLGRIAGDYLTYDYAATGATIRVLKELGYGVPTPDDPA